MAPEAYLPASRSKGKLVNVSKKLHAKRMPPPAQAPDACDAHAHEHARLLSEVVEESKSHSTVTSSTSEAHAQQRKRVLASVHGKLAPLTPQAVSREERYNNRSAEKERAITPKTQDCP